MGKILDIDGNIPHKVSEVICINCKNRFIDTRPAQVLLKDLTCPYCRQVGYIIETGEEIE